MKKLSVLLALIFVLIMAPVALADDTIDYQVDSGQFNCWLHSDGKTWQKVPGYGVVKPYDSVTFTYTVSYDGANKDKITGVKSVSYYLGDMETYNKTARPSWQPYKRYKNSKYYKSAVKDLIVNSFNYLGDGRVEISITTTLDTVTIDESYPDYPGAYMKEPHQGKLVQGRRFYTPTVIEWQKATPVAAAPVTPPDFWPSSPTGISFTGKPGSTITIPVEVWNSSTKETTDFIAFWNGTTWDDAIARYDNLTIDKGKKADTPVNVTVPAVPTTLWLRANVDNNTPATEQDITNNVLGVTIGPNTADVAVSISVNTTSPLELEGVTATVKVVNNGPAPADIYLETGENNGSNQVLKYVDDETFTLAPGASKIVTYESGGYDAGYSTYLATKATVKNTTDPNLANNFARSPRITWKAYTPPPVVPSKQESSLIH